MTPPPPQSQSCSAAPVFSCFAKKNRGTKISLFRCLVTPVFCISADPIHTAVRSNVMKVRLGGEWLRAYGQMSFGTIECHVDTIEC